MSDLDTYTFGILPPWGTKQEAADHVTSIDLIKRGVLVPDSTLQSIADAWNEGKPKRYINDIRKQEVRRNWPELAEKLDALGDNEQIPFSTKMTTCPNCGATGRGCNSAWCYGTK